MWVLNSGLLYLQVEAIRQASMARGSLSEAKPSSNWDVTALCIVKDLCSLPVVPPQRKFLSAVGHQQYQEQNNFL